MDTIDATTTSPYNSATSPVSQALLSNRFLKSKFNNKQGFSNKMGKNAIFGELLQKTLKPEGDSEQEPSCQSSFCESSSSSHVFFGEYEPNSNSPQNDQRPLEMAEQIGMSNPSDRSVTLADSIREPSKTPI